MKNQEKNLSRIERKKIRMKNNIIDIAINLIETQGFESTTMEQIARDTDIAKGTLYKYFPEKEAIINEYIKRSFERKNTFRIEEIKNLTDTNSRISYIMNNLLDGIKFKKEIFEKYLVYTMKQVVSFESNEEKGSGITTLTRTIIELGRKEGSIRCDMKISMIADFFIFIVIMAAKEFYINTEEFNQEEVINKCVNLFINGVKPSI